MNLGHSLPYLTYLPTCTCVGSNAFSLNIISLRNKMTAVCKVTVSLFVNVIILIISTCSLRMVKAHVPCPWFLWSRIIMEGLTQSQERLRITYTLLLFGRTLKTAILLLLWWSEAPEPLEALGRRPCTPC